MFSNTHEYMYILYIYVCVCYVFVHTYTWPAIIHVNICVYIYIHIHTTLLSTIYMSIYTYVYIYIWICAVYSLIMCSCPYPSFKYLQFLLIMSWLAPYILDIPYYVEHISILFYILMAVNPTWKECDSIHIHPCYIRIEEMIVITYEVYQIMINYLHVYLAIYIYIYVSIYTYTLYMINRTLLIIHYTFTYASTYT